MDFPKINNPKEKLIEFKIIPTTNRLTFDITWQHPETRYIGEDDGDYMQEAWNYGDECDQADNDPGRQFELGEEIIAKKKEIKNICLKIGELDE